MIIDLHSHSIKSDDGRAKVENYCKWIRSKEIPIDGFVLTEHRQFDFESDYSALAEEYGLVIMKASEVETDYGHVLVYGVTPPLVEAYDFTNIALDMSMVLEVTEAHGAVPVPAHPGRPRAGMHAHVQERGMPAGVKIVETRNGGSRDNEDEIAAAMADEHGFRGTGGSDAHIVSQIGRRATRFANPVRNEAELVEALKSGEFEAI